MDFLFLTFRPAHSPPYWSDMTSKKSKKARNEELQHKLLAYLSERIGGPLDGYFGQNYDACTELIQRCLKHGSEPFATITTLIDVATSKECWHAKNATNFRYLLNHGRAIVNAHREKFAKRDRLSEATQRAEQYFASRPTFADGKS